MEFPSPCGPWKSPCPALCVEGPLSDAAGESAAARCRLGARCPPEAGTTAGTVLSAATAADPGGPSLWEHLPHHPRRCHRPLQHGAFQRRRAGLWEQEGVAIDMLVLASLDYEFFRGRPGVQHTPRWTVACPAPLPGHRVGQAAYPLPSSGSTTWRPRSPGRRDHPLLCTHESLPQLQHVPISDSRRLP